MEISKILTADILDILFEGKNKEYGAYELRRSYSKRLRLSIAVTSLVVLLCVTGFLFAGNETVIVSHVFDIPETELDKVKPDEPKVIPPPVVKQPEFKERRNTQIIVVPNHMVPPDEEVPPNEELETAKIGLVNKEGPVFDGIPGPVQESIGKGIIEPPKRENPDSVFMTVQIESEYPGGTEAWRRFLIKNLANNYPQEAADAGIQGKVVVMFIVDKEGAVSDVHAIEGPKELHESAMRVIRKSGKWNPAQQNGRRVNSYKRQPIVFSIGEP